MNAKPSLLPLEPEVAEVAPELHHYTNLAGLTGILTTQSLWAVQYDKMNDPTEFNHIRDILVGAMKTRMRDFVRRKRMSMPRLNKAILEHGGINPAVDYETGVWINALHGTLTRNREDGRSIVPHVTSFCSHADEPYERENGLLSQWRGYGGHEQAFAIVFDTKKLNELIKAEYARFQYYGGFMIGVVYDDDDFDIVGKYPALIEKIDESWQDAFHRRKPDLKDLIEPLIKVSIRLKHRAFHEEREIRLVMLPNLDDGNRVIDGKRDERPLKVQSQDHRPHISVLGPEFGDLPIRRIIVGPCGKFDEAIQNARSLSGGKIAIVASKTPFRVVR